jgi:hypothetical protein
MQISAVNTEMYGGDMGQYFTPHKIYYVNFGAVLGDFGKISKAHAIKTLKNILAKPGHPAGTGRSPVSFSIFIECGPTCAKIFFEPAKNDMQQIDYMGV